MESKDYWIVALGMLGWIWAVVQFVLNRRYAKSDKAVEKRFEVYSNFMNQMDEMSMSLRNDPNMTYGVSNEFMSEVLNGDEEQINAALLKMNKNLLEITKKSIQPLIIMNQELNKLKLVASENLLPKINEYKFLIQDYTNEFQLVLNKMSSSDDLEKNAKELEIIGQNERNKRMGILWSEIEGLMRDEIDYYKK